MELGVNDLYPSSICPDILLDGSFFVAGNNPHVSHIRRRGNNREGGANCRFDVVKRYTGSSSRRNSVYTVVECGRRVVYAGDNQGHLTVFSRNTGRQIRENAVSTGCMTSICRSKDSVLCGLGDGKCPLYDSHTLKWLMTLEECHQTGVVDVCHVDGNKFLTADSTTIGIWDCNLPPRQRLVQKMAHTGGSITSVAVCPNGTVSAVSVAVKGTACVEAWDIESGNSVRRHEVDWPSIDIDFASIKAVEMKECLSKSIPSVMVVYGGSLKEKEQKQGSGNTKADLLRHLSNHTPPYMVQFCDFRGERHHINREFLTPSEKRVTCCGAAKSILCFGLQPGIVGVDLAALSLPQPVQKEVQYNRIKDMHKEAENQKKALKNVYQYMDSTLTKDGKLLNTSADARTSLKASADSAVTAALVPEPHSKVHQALLISKFNTDVLVAGKTQNFEEIKKVLQHMKNMKVWPSTFTYDLAIRACATEKNFTAVLWLLRDMRAIGLRLEERTGCAIFRAFDSSRRNSVSPQQFLAEIRKSGVVPAGQVRETYIEALANIGQISGAIADLRQALKTASIIRPDSAVFVNVLRACREKTRASAVKNILQLIDLARTKMTFEVYESAIDAFAKVRSPEESTKVMEDMIATFGIKASLGPICKIISAFGDRNQFHNSIKLYNFLLRNGVDASTRAVASLLRAAAKTHNYDTMMTIFREASSKSSLPQKDIETFCLIVESLSKDSLSDYASEIVDTLQGHGYQIGSNPRLLSLLVKALVTDGHMKEALQLFLSIGDKFDESSDIGMTLSGLVEEVGRQHDTEKLHQILQPIRNMLKRHVDHEADIWASLIQAYVDCNEPRHGTLTYKHMQEHGVKCTRKGYNAVLLAHAHLQEAEEVFIIANKVTHAYGLQRDTFKAIIESYNTLHDIEKSMEYVTLFLTRERVCRTIACRKIKRWWASIRQGGRRISPSVSESSSRLEDENMAAIDYSNHSVEAAIYSLFFTLIEKNRLADCKKLVVAFRHVLSPVRPLVYQLIGEAFLKENMLLDAAWSLMSLSKKYFSGSVHIVSTLVVKLCREGFYEDGKRITAEYYKYGIPSRSMLHALLRSVPSKSDNPIGIYDSMIAKGVVANEASIGLLIESLLRCNRMKDAIKVWENFRKCEGMGRIPPKSLECLFDALVAESGGGSLRVAAKVAVDLERDNHPVSFYKANELYLKTYPTMKAPLEKENKTKVVKLETKSSFQRKFDSFLKKAN